MSSQRRKRLLVDVDEVLADFQTPALEIAHRLTGKRLTPFDYEVWDMFTLFTEAEKRAIFEEIEKPGFCRTLLPRPGAIEAIREIQTLVDVYPVTSPFHSLTWVHERNAWLQEHFGFKSSQVVHTSAKFLVLGDAFIDDNPSHVAAWQAEHPGGVPMLWHIENTRTMTEFDPLRVKTWGEVIARVKTLETLKDVYDMIEEREWHFVDDGHEYNECWECGADTKKERERKHVTGCRMGLFADWARRR